MASPATESFVQDLLGIAPGFRPEYEEHLADNDQLLPHVLLGDFTRWLRARVADGDSATVGTVLGFLESSYAAGDEDVQELISVSFLENLIGESELDELRPQLGPELSKALEALETFSP